MATKPKQELAPVAPTRNGGEPSGVRMQSPTGHVTTVPESIVNDLLESGYVQVK